MSVETKGTPDAGIGSARGECPACGMPAPFKRAVIKTGPFVCKGCGRALRTGKSGKAAALAAFAAASLLGKTFGVLAAVAVLLALAIQQWLAIRVYLDESGPGSTQ
jgi:uncharacterized protein (DUF983 family)